MEPVEQLEHLLAPGRLALAVGLSLFFGLAFEEFYAERLPSRPGGVRTFPLLTIAGILLWLPEPMFGLLFLGGLLVLGLLLNSHYRASLRQERAVSEDGTAGEIVIAACNVLAYSLGPVALHEPPWVPVAAAVAAVLLLGARKWLHELANRVEVHELRTLAKFLILIGVILPLAPNEPVVEFTTLTPRQVWLAVVVVSGLSYGSYLLQKHASAHKGALAAGLLGGLYSSTATTVVLARHASGEGSARSTMNAAITLATTMMYLRILVVVAIFDWRLALLLAPWLTGLAATGALLAWACHRFGRDDDGGGESVKLPHNPLELGSALFFAAMFVVISVVTAWVQANYGNMGVYGLAAVVGIVDIDPFVLGMAQGKARALAEDGRAAAILVAASSNNALKGSYALVFARAGAWRAAASLFALAAAGLAVTWLVLRGASSS